MERLDEMSRQSKKPRSHVLQEALRLWRRMQINDKLAEGYRAMFENDRETAERHFACIYGDSEMKSLTPRRVELWLVNFNLGRGSGQGGVRPTLIRQNDTGNIYAARRFWSPYPEDSKTDRLIRLIKILARTRIPGRKS